MPPISKKAVESKSIDRYQLKEPIGRGGMGLVYRAYDPVVRRDVALKTIRGSPDRMALELFRKECSVLASLSHPNIIEIFDIGEFTEEGESKPYFVMPLLPGVTLAELIREAGQRLTVDRAVEIIIQTCRGLQAAHESGVVHRDLKPSNIFVMQDDSVKIIDFGMVHMVDTQTSMTIKGGTLHYMAPEQVQMQPASALSDIFSLGVVLYETLTRRRPFEGSSENDVVEGILNRIPPPASDLNPAVSQLVSRVVHKAIAKQPWYRFSSAREFSEILQKAVRREHIEIFDAIRIQPRIQRATKATEQGDYQFAGEILSELEAEGHLDSAIPFLRSQIEKGKRQKTILQLLESARTRIDGEEYLLALQKLQEVLQLDPNNTSALSLRNTVENRRSEQKIDEWFRLARQHLDNHAFSHARDALQSVLQIKPKDTRAQQMMAEIDRREKEYLRIRTEKEQLYQSAVNAWQSGDVSMALTKLERLVELDRKAPDSSAPERGVSIQSFYNQVRSEHDALRGAYEEARKYLVDCNFTMALTVCVQYLTKYPGHALFQALKFDVEERQRQEWSARIAEIDRRVEAEPDPDRKVNILKEALDLHPGEVHFERSLRLMRDKRDLVHSIVAKARNHEECAQFNEALGQLEILQSVYRQYPGLEFEIQRVAQRRDQQSSAGVKARWVELIDRELESGNHSRAFDLAQNALAEFPGDAELAALEKLARRGRERAAEAQRFLALGKELCAKNRAAEGLAALRRAFETGEQNAALLGELLDALLAQAQGAVEADLPLAQALVQQILELDPVNALATSLQSMIQDRQREEFITHCIASARQLQANDNIEGALAQIEHAQSAYPEEVRLKQLRATLTKALDESQSKREEFIARCLAEARQRQTAGDLKGASERVQRGLASYRDEPRLSHFAAALQKLLQDAKRNREVVVAECLTEVQRLEGAGDLRGALAQVDHGLSLHPDEVRLYHRQSTLKAALQEELAESRAEHEQSVELCLEQARQQENMGNVPGALAQVEQGLASYPDDPHLLQAAASYRSSIRESRRQREDFITCCIDEARQLQNAGDLSGALANVRSVLAAYPNEGKLEQLKAALEQAIEDAERSREEFVLWCLAQARNREEGGDLDSALGHVEEGLSSYPQEPSLRKLESRLRKMLDEARRKREELIAGFLAHTRQYQAVGDLPEALAKVEEGLAACPDESRLIQMRAGVLRALQDLRRKKEESVTRCMTHARELYASDDLQAALELIEQGLASYPDESRLRQLYSTLQKAIEESRRKKEEVVTHCMARARQLESNGDLQGALTEVENGLSFYPDESALVQIHVVLMELVEQSRRKREDLVIDCITESRRMQAAGDLKGALARLARGLSAYPEEPRLTHLRSALETTSRPRRQWVRPMVGSVAVLLVIGVGYLIYGDYHEGKHERKGREHGSASQQLRNQRDQDSAKQENGKQPQRQEEQSQKIEAAKQAKQEAVEQVRSRADQRKKTNSIAAEQAGQQEDRKKTEAVTQAKRDATEEIKRDALEQARRQEDQPRKTAAIEQSKDAVVVPAVPNLSIREFCGEPPNPRIESQARKKGTISWIAEHGGTIGTIIICGRGALKASKGAIMKGPELPGVPITITSIPEVTMLELPDSRNGWSSLAFQVDQNTSRVIFTWQLTKSQP